MRTPFLHIAVLTAFLANSIGPIPLAFAQTSPQQAGEFRLPQPGVMVHLSPPMNPPLLKGIKVHPNNPFQFDFIFDKGESGITNGQISQESSKLIKYFLASLTIPEKDLWVNLSPYEKERIIPANFGLTEMGRDLLAEDYMLKQITASLIYPGDRTGKKFWKRVYQEASLKYGTTNIPVNTFNKVWIVPEKGLVYENAQAATAFVLESKLKVMLESDYLALKNNKSSLSLATRKDINSIGANITREIIIPELTKEVNEGNNFLKLRQIYNSLILATWYKKKIKDSLLLLVYADQNKVKGVSVRDPNEKQKIYDRYLKAFKKGVFNYIKDDVDIVSHESIPRKYFSGGLLFTNLAMASVRYTSDRAMFSKFQLGILSATMFLVSCAARPVDLPKDHRLLPQAQFEERVIVQSPLAKMIHPSEYFFKGGKAPLPEEYTSLQPLSGVDLYHILEWGQGGELSVFDDIYEKWVKETGSGFTHFEFKEWVKGLSVAEIVQIVQDAIKKEKPGNYNIASSRFKEVLEVLRSDDFKQNFKWLRENRRLSESPNPYYEVYEVFMGEKQLNLIVLRSLKFGEFQKFVLNNYKFSWVPLNELLRAFLEPTMLKEINNPERIQAFDLVRRNFPHAKFSFVDILQIEDLIVKGQHTHQTMSELIEGRMQKASRLHERLTPIYGEDCIKSMSDIVAILKEGTEEKLFAGKVLRNWDYLRTNYHHLIYNNSISDLLDGPIDAFLRMQPSFEEVSNFLKIFGLRIDQFNYLELGLTFNQISRDNLFLKDVNFHSFVHGIFEQYPELTDISKNNPTSINFLSIVEAYKHREVFDNINRLLRDLDPKVNLPYFDLEGSGRQIAILEALRSFGKGKFRVILDKNNKILFTSSHLSLDLRIFTDPNGSAHQLYRKLVEEWGVKEINLVEFLEVLSKPRELNFFLNNDNLRKFKDISEKYDFTVQELSNQILFDVGNITTLIDKYDFLMKPETVDVYRKYFQPQMGGMDRRKDLLFELSYDFLKGETFMGTADFIEKSRILDQVFSFSPEEVWSLFRDREKITMENLNDRNIRGNYTQLRSFYIDSLSASDFKIMGNLTILTRAVRMDGYTGDLRADLQNLTRFGFTQLDNWDVFDYVTKLILKDNDVLTNLRDPNFADFFHRATEYFYGGERKLDVLVELSTVYSRFSPDKRRVLFSDKFQRTLDYIGDVYAIRKLDPRILEEVLSVAVDFDDSFVQKMNQLHDKLEQQGEPVSANDFLTLAWIARYNHGEYMPLILNRNALENAVAPIYRTKANPGVPDGVSILMKTKPAGEELLRDISKIEHDTTGRPDPHDVPSLLLFRAHLFKMAVDQDPNLRSQLGQVIWDNIKLNIKVTGDKIGREMGGEIHADPVTGKISIRPLHTFVEENGAFSANRYNLFEDDLMSWHSHAVNNSGQLLWANRASGLIEGSIPGMQNAGDLAYVRSTHGTDVVFTPLRRFHDGAGRLGMVIYVYPTTGAKYRDRNLPYSIDLGAVDVIYKDDSPSTKPTTAPTTNEANKAQSSVGGIDLSAGKVIHVENSGEEIVFHMDAAMFEKYQNASGFVPFINKIQPLKDVENFLNS